MSEQVWVVEKRDTSGYGRFSCVRIGVAEAAGDPGEEQGANLAGLDERRIVLGWEPVLAADRCGFVGDLVGGRVQPAQQFGAQWPGRGAGRCSDGHSGT